MLEIIYKKTSDLIPYVNNTRTHTEKQINQVIASIREFGFCNPILIDENDNIIAGHCRLLAAQKDNIDKVPSVTLSGLTAAQKKAYIIADNRLAENAGWDLDLLKLELESLKEMDFDLDLLGFDDDLDELMEDTEDIEDIEDDDFDSTPPEKPKSKLNDIWILGKHRLLCGDATSKEDVNILMDGAVADMVITDPPYGYKYESNHQEKHEMLKNDDKFLDFVPAIYDYMNENCSIFIFSSFQVIAKWIEYISETFKYKNLIVWKKNNWSMGDLKGAFAGQHELIIFAHKGRVELIGKRDSDIWEFSRKNPDVHPTQKPVEMIAYAISKVKCSNVLDIFGGSGSTLIACEKTNRKCFMVELDEKYVDVIVKRYAELKGCVDNIKLIRDGKEYKYNHIFIEEAEDA